MGHLTTLLKRFAKVGIVGGSSYFAVKEGFLGQADESAKAYERVKMAALENEYVKMMPEVKFPRGVIDYMADSASFREYQGTIRRYWNSGVIFSFEKLIKLPGAIKYYYQVGLDWVANASGEIKSVEEASKKET